MAKMQALVRSPRSCSVAQLWTSGYAARPRAVRTRDCILPPSPPYHVRLYASKFIKVLIAVLSVQSPDHEFFCSVSSCCLASVCIFYTWDT